MNRQFAIIKKAWLWLLVGAVLMAGALYVFFTNMRFSIQFTGGMEVVVENDIDETTFTQTLNEELTSAGFEDFHVGVGEKDGYESVLLQISIADDNQVSEVTRIVEETLLSTNTIADSEGILESAIIGPSIGDYIRKTAKNALVWGVILMAVYILIAFAGMRKLISPVLLAGVTIITMLFDVSIASGGYGLMMQLNHAVQIDTIFIIALLTVLGYSVNDTIVIFDRIRENFIDKEGALEKGQITRGEIFEMSLWQTMRRSIATSLSTLLVIIGMFIFGTGILKMFAFTLGIGVIAGTYSSIFLAAPFAYLLSSRNNK